MDDVIRNRRTAIYLLATGIKNSVKRTEKLTHAFISSWQASGPYQHQRPSIQCKKCHVSKQTRFVKLK